MHLHGAKLLMAITMGSYIPGPDQYLIELFDVEKKEYVYSANLQETIEDLLIGKTVKDIALKARDCNVENS